MLTFLTGLAAGGLHVVSGPDHLAALAPIALRDGRSAVRVGATWGAGHGLGVVLVGLLAMVLQQFVAAQWLSDFSERLVGLLLIGVGAWALRVARGVTVHAHGHGHEDHHHEHLHLHVGDVGHDARAHRGHSHLALGAGVLHGAAGAGHLLGVLPALALPPLWAALYLGCYLLGAIAAMAGFAAVLGSLVSRVGPGAVRQLMVASALGAIGIGAFWLVGPTGL